MGGEGGLQIKLVTMIMSAPITAANNNRFVILNSYITGSFRLKNNNS